MTTGIDYIALYEGYLKLIMSGIHHGKAEFINIIQEWDEAIFQGTKMSIVGCRSSSGTYSSHLSPLLKQKPPCHYPFAKDKTARGRFLKNTTSKGAVTLLSEY